MTDQRQKQTRNSLYPFEQSFHFIRSLSNKSAQKPSIFDGNFRVPQIRRALANADESMSFDPAKKSEKNYRVFCEEFGEGLARPTGAFTVHEDTTYVRGL